MAGPYRNLNPEKALIWRIVHRDNLPWILENGLHCETSPIRSVNYVAIGNADLISRRAHREVPIAPGGTLADYIPFYFTPFSPMMYNIYTGRSGIAKRSNEEICILVSSLPKMQELGQKFIFTDRHAYTRASRYFSSMDHIGEVDWPLLQARNFARNPDDPAQIERYQAEALIHRHMPISGLLGVVCYTQEVKDSLDAQAQARKLALEVHVRPKWYFP